MRSHHRLETVLSNHAERRSLLEHRIFLSDAIMCFDRQGAETLLGQWWHPLHYFPTFLSRCVAVSPSVTIKSYVANILNEELGEGDPQHAHEQVYLRTLASTGFDAREISSAPAFDATTSLVDHYQTCSGDPVAAIGCIYATEVIDLFLVGGIGRVMHRVTGAVDLEWVDIHVRQEPNHVAKANLSIEDEFSANERSSIIRHAADHWARWRAFFDEIATRAIG